MHALPPPPFLDRNPRPRSRLTALLAALNDPHSWSYLLFGVSAVLFFTLGTGHGEPEVECMDPRAIVIGDVHGCGKELKTLLRRAKLRPGCDLLYFVGDIIGKGPTSVATLREVRALSLSSLHVGAVMGNHEAGFLRWLDARARSSEPLPGTAEHERWATTFGSDELMWIRERPLHVSLPAEFGHVRVVHAGMVPGSSVAEQHRDDLLTLRSLLPNGTGSALPGPRGSASWAASWNGPEHLVFGHDARRKLQRHPHATGLDTGCVYGGKLTALILHQSQPTPGGGGNATSSADLTTLLSVVLPAGPAAMTSKCATRAPCLLHVAAQKGSCAKPTETGKSKSKGGKARGVKPGRRAKMQQMVEEHTG